MSFRKSPYKVYWAAKTMEDLFVPTEKCDFFGTLSDTYVMNPGDTIKNFADCVNTKFEGANENMKPPFLFEDDTNNNYFVLRKSTKKRQCYTVNEKCPSTDEVYSRDPKDLASGHNSAKSNGFNFKVHS